MKASLITLSSLALVSSAAMLVVSIVMTVKLPRRTRRFAKNDAGQSSI